MRKRILFLTILLLGFQLVFTEPSWPTEINENNKLLASALKDLQQTIIEKIEHEADTTATAFADAQNIERDLSLKDIFRTPLVIIEETINTIGSLINARKLTENANQILDSSETNLQLVSGIMSITTLKQIGENLQLAIDGPSYCSTIEKMLDKAYRRSSTRIKFNPDAYKTVIKDYLYAQYEPGPLRIPHKSTDFTRRNLEIASGTYEIERTIRKKLRALIDNLEDNPLSPHSAVEAINQIEKIKRAIVASKGSNQNLSYETYLKDKTGNYIPSTVDLTLGSTAELEKVRQIAVEHHEKEMKIEQIITISRAARATGQTTALYLHTTYNSSETGEIFGEMQKWSIIPQMIEVGISKVFGTNAREQVNMIPQEMMMTLPLELSNVWMVADDTANYIEYLIEAEKEQPPKEVSRGIPAEIKLKDKSIIKGEILQEKIKIKTKYGEMDIPVENFVSIIGQLIELKDETTLKGNIADKVLNVKTDYGKLKVQTKDIDFIIFAKGEKPPVKEPFPPSEEKTPIPQFHGVYLVTNGKLIELKRRFQLEIPAFEVVFAPISEKLIELKQRFQLSFESLSGIDILDPDAYIIFYQEYPPTLYKLVTLAKLYYNGYSNRWEIGVEEIELKTTPVKGDKIGAYKLIPIVPLSPGVYALVLVRYLGIEMFDFSVNYQKYKENLKIQAEKHYKLGMSYFEKGQYNEAIGEYQKALKITPDRVDIQKRLAEAYFLTNKYDSAARAMRKVIFDEKGKERPDVTQAQKSLWKKIKGRLKFEKHYLAGLDHMGEENYDEAIKEFKKAIEIQPNIGLQPNEGWIAYHFLGLCYYYKEMYDEAIAELRKAVQSKYKCPPAPHVFLGLSLGLSYYSKGMYDEAIAELRKVKVHPSAHYPLGRCYYEKKMYDEAIVEFEKTLQTKYKYPAFAHYFLSRCYYKKKMYDEAIAEVNRALKLLKTEKGNERFQKEAEEFLQKLKAEKIQKAPEAEKKAQETPKKGEAKMPRVMARVSNADDKAVMYVNGQEAISVTWGTGPGGKSIGHRPGDSGWVDITPYLEIEDNILRFWVWNKAVYGAVSATFEVQIDGVLAISRSFKKQDSTAGVKYDETVILSLPKPPLKVPEAEEKQKALKAEPKRRETPRKEKAVSNIALAKPVSITTNGVEDSLSHAGDWPSDITDGSLDYQPASEGIEDGCVGWSNDDYNELMVITATIDLQGTYNITKIRYNPGNCQRAETWNADIIESPFGRTPTTPGSPYQGTWTEQTGNITASKVTIKLEKTRRSWATNWLFIGEIEVFGTPI